MGLDASVRCNCFELGLTKPPPISRDLIYIDEDGWLSVDPAVEENMQIVLAFDQWLYSEGACSHNMAYARVRVANWSGYRLFQGALGRAGWEHFPVLREQLPASNGGSMPASLAPSALMELKYFREAADLGSAVFLVDSETGKELRESIESYGGEFLWSGKTGLVIGFDADGLYIRTATDHPAVMFRSKSFEQHLLEPELTDADGSGRVEYLDTETGISYVCTLAIGEDQIPWPDGRMQDDKGRVRLRYPRHMHVEKRKVTADRFEYILQPLTEIFEAAIATGNPVRWS